MRGHWCSGDLLVNVIDKSRTENQADLTLNPHCLRIINTFETHTVVAQELVQHHIESNLDQVDTQVVDTNTKKHPICYT